MRDLAEGRGGDRALSTLEVAGLRWWLGFLKGARPREIAVGPPPRPVVILTDGAVEEFASVGGLLFDSISGVFECFGARVPDEVARSWGRRLGDEQVIGQAELAPMVLAARLWRDLLRGRHVLFFVDNDSAKDAAVRGYSPSLPSALLVGALWQALAEVAAVPWFDRVPGPSNLADGPSRLNFERVLSLGASVKELRAGHWEAVRCVLEHSPPRGRKRHRNGGESGCL